jgi:16S rRNA (uracil1498-N3)-methyltransferase
MATPRIYWPSTLSLGQSVALQTDTIHHLITVLRLKSGENVFLFNGEGEYLTTLTLTGKKSALLTIVSKNTQQRESPLKLELATCLYRGKQFDTSIQKAVELGVHAITPIISHKSDVVTKAAFERNKQLENTVVAACAQSGRVQLPQVNAEISLTTWIEQSAHTMAIACDFFPTTLDWKSTPLENQRISVLIGPAGGFSESESLALKEAMIQNLYLGPRTLRSDTATAIALGLVQHHWGDLS